MPDRRTPIRYKQAIRVTAHPQEPGTDAHDLPQGGVVSRVKGPPILLEDELIPISRKTLVVSLLDLSSLFIRRNVGSLRKLFFYTQLYGNIAGNQGTLEQAPLRWSRTQLESGLGRSTLGLAGLSPTAVIVSDSAHGEYRRTFERWPLPFLNSGAYGLSLNVGTREFPVSTGTPQWLQREPANGVEVAERATPWSASTTADATTTANLWHDRFPDWWRNDAQLRLRPRSIRSRWSVTSQTTLPCFEHLDPFDVDNFKVLEGPSETTPPVIDVTGRGLDALQVGLVPRFWTYSISFVEWALHTTDGVTPATLFSRTGTVHAEMLGIVCPYVNAYSIAQEPLNQISYQVGNFAGSGGIFILSGVDHPTSTTFVASFDGLPPQSTSFAAGGPSYGDQHTNFLMFMMSAILFGRGDADTSFSAPYPVGVNVIERSNSIMTLTVSDTPVNALVGKLRYSGRQFDVRRRTVNPGGQVVYSGGLDSLGVASPWGLSNYHNSFYNSFTRTFAMYDPLNLVAHVAL